MGMRKYMRDYRLDDELDARGKLRTRTVYVGGDYDYVAPERATRKAKAAAGILHAASWLMYIGALLPLCTAHHTAYVILPFVAAVFPLGYESIAIWTLMRRKPPLWHEQADRITKSLPIEALLTLIFSGAAFAGMIVRAILDFQSLLPGDAVFLTLAGLLAAASAILLRLVKRFQAEKCT